LENSQINFPGTEQVDIVEGSIGGNNLDGYSFFFGDLFDVLSDLIVGPFLGTGRDGDGTRVVMQKQHPGYHY
jgi:hypothetical protein